MSVARRWQWEAAGLVPLLLAGCGHTPAPLPEPMPYEDTPAAIVEPLFKPPLSERIGAALLESSVRDVLAEAPDPSWTSGGEQSVAALVEALGLAADDEPGATFPLPSTDLSRFLPALDTAMRRRGVIWADREELAAAVLHYHGPEAARARGIEGRLRSLEERVSTLESELARFRSARD